MSMINNLRLTANEMSFTVQEDSSLGSAFEAVTYRIRHVDANFYNVFRNPYTHDMQSGAAFTYIGWITTSGFLTPEMVMAKFEGVNGHR
jgi:hypothetical protein